MMASFEHKKIADRINAFSALPSETDAFLDWIAAGQHLDFLRSNSEADHIVLYATGSYCFIYGFVVPETLLDPPDKDDLLTWSCDPYGSAASYVTGGGRAGIWVEHDYSGAGSKTLAMGTQLLYGRTFEGWSGEGRDYFEIAQEFAHLEEIHWRPEHSSYCRYDRHGDLDEVVCITGTGSAGLTLVTIKREALESYLAASRQRLLQLFDFTLFESGNFSGWQDGEEQIIQESGTLFYRQRIESHAAYTRGVQILELSRTEEEIFEAKQNAWFGGGDERYAEFIVHDWRNNRVVRVSAAPSHTTNYFDAKDNDLPFELSPAFFKPEVLSKYKTDSDKYTVGERDIHCRAAWFLRGYDVNEAGQVHAYIGDLAKIPYEEQLHWQSYNEDPKSSISRRAIETDFKGQFTDIVSPLSKILEKVRRWNEASNNWWRVRDQRTIDGVSIPYTSSRDEWADSFMNLTKLVNEGFVVQPIREQLRQRNIEFTNKEGSLALLEKLLGDINSDTVRLEGLRTAQLIRTKVRGHSSGAEAEELARAALAAHESFAKHFSHICEQVYADLIRVEDGLSRV